MIDRFKDSLPGNNHPLNTKEVLPIADYMGGDIAGVAQKLKEGYFDSLGINTIWLSPITQNPEGAYGLWKNPKTKFSGYHGYWPVSSSRIDYRYGTPEELKELITEAHKRNINVIWIMLPITYMRNIRCISSIKIGRQIYTFRTVA